MVFGAVVLIEDANDTNKICPKVKSLITGEEFYMTMPHGNQERVTLEMSRAEEFKTIPSWDAVELHFRKKHNFNSHVYPQRACLDFAKTVYDFIVNSQTKKEV